MHSLTDRLIIEFDSALRTLLAPATGSRPCPRSEQADESLTSDEAKEVSRLMRVNHTGEVCAQALYQGQALFARTPESRNLLRLAAQEERDHLAWCEKRLGDLGAAPSVLNPVWYAGSFALGAASGLAGDKWSMGFLVETERQVEHHLSDHLQRVPEKDAATRVILEAMREDEIRHGQSALIRERQNCLNPSEWPCAGYRAS